ncbi:hypothetical protein BN1723_001657 [Verticillium longisporum]|uniref:Uncharacterized protein n=1 Tax=Verticillium longisporum TaxID=100787 RepID=A0A0G4KJW3_VERLO|nr:hypothetical protein BN1723_001657 [Verticillium longisporum]
MRSSPTANLLLDELPMYGAPLKVPTFDFSGPEFDPDAHWKRPALPLNKYVEGQMKLLSEGPPRKRGRYEYEEEEEDDEDRVIFGEERFKGTNVAPESADVALFNPDLKSIRDRLHASHQFRPPAEYNMPMQSFYESRHASQWTPAEDEELRDLTVFSEPCTVSAAASTTWTNVSDDGETLDSKADIEFNGLSLVTAKAVVNSTSSTVGNVTTSPSTSSVLCNPTYCQDSTLYCHYWAGVTGWDVSLGLVPGMQRSSIGECEPVTGSASLIDSAAATATATATVTAT